jgi:predicted hotdog family 3-hydroxylacyl-ACP dehydratase
MILTENTHLVQVHEVANYLPQQAPFIMVDALIVADEKSATSSFCILAENVLVFEGVFQESGLLENIAQTIALKSGFEAAKQHAKPKIGFIVLIKKIELFDLPIIGETIRTNVEIIMKFDSMLVVRGESFVEDRKCCSCEMSLFLEK